ncbi:unnamed protein product [Colias eurytheme]|nr:unnamed protein product [Colias eurytheme]
MCFIISIAIDQKIKVSNQKITVTGVRGDNTNTPIRTNLQTQRHLSSSDDEECQHHNITQRKKSAKLSNFADVENNDPNLMSFIKNEIQLAVHEAVKSAIQSCISKELHEIREQLTVLKEFKNSLDFMSADYDKIKGDLINHQEILLGLKKENSLLQNNLNDLSMRINLLEQHARENNVELNGLPENKSENLISVMKQLCAVISYPIQESDIITCTRVRKLDDTNKRPRSVIYKLRSTHIRDGIIAAVSKFNKSSQNNRINSSHLGYGGALSPLYISEHLSPFYKSLHAKTRNVAKEKGIRFVWVRNGRIFTRKDEFSQSVQIKNFECLAKIQ